MGPPKGLTLTHIHTGPWSSPTQALLWNRGYFPVEVGEHWTQLGTACAKVLRPRSPIHQEWP